jgi:hypothetical protein
VVLIVTSVTIAWGYFHPLPEREADERKQQNSGRNSHPKRLHRLVLACLSNGYSSFPIATAVSAMRLEKPHSLSYHAITRTSVPFCTLV